MRTRIIFDNIHNKRTISSWRLRLYARSTEVRESFAIIPETVDRIILHDASRNHYCCEVDVLGGGGGLSET